MKFSEWFFGKEKKLADDTVLEQDPAEFAVEEEKQSQEVETQDTAIEENSEDIAEQEIGRQAEQEVEQESEQQPEQDVEQQAEDVAEAMLNNVDELSVLIDENFAEEFEKIRAEFEGGEFEGGEEAVKKLKAELIEKLQGQTSKNRLAGFLKHTATKFTLPALAGAGLRGVVKSSARAYLGWTSLGGSIGLGALIGGGFAAIETYWKERLKVDSNDVLRQLDEALKGNDKVRIAEIIDKGRKALKNDKLLPLEVNMLKVKLQKAELLLRLELSKEKLEKLSDAKKFLAVMHESRDSRKSLRKLEGIKNERQTAGQFLKNLVQGRLFSEKVKFETQKNPQFKAKLVKNILVGAASGALGGGVGYGMHALLDSDSVRSVFGWAPGDKSSEKITEQAIEKTGKILQVNPNVAEQATVAMGTLQQGVVNAHAHESLASLQKELLQQKFITVAEKGEGATHAARDLLHDYLVNKNHLSGDTSTELSPEQLAKLVFAEDTLMKEHFLDQTKGVGHVVELGQKFELTGDQIQNAWDKANQLSPEKIANLTKLLNSPGHRLSEQSMDLLKNDKIGSDSNHFFEKLLEHAKPVEVAPVDSATIEAQQEVARAVADESAKKAGDAITKPVDSYARAGVVDVVEVLLGIGAGYGAYKLKKHLKHKSVSEINATADARLEDLIAKHDPENQSPEQTENDLVETTVNVETDEDAEVNEDVAANEDAESNNDVAVDTAVVAVAAPRKGTRKKPPELAKPEDIYQEAEAKGLAKSQRGIWFDLMRQDGGLLNSAVSKEGFKSKDIKKIQDTLRSISEYAVDADQALNNPEVKKLVSIYETFYKMSQRVGPGVDNDRISKIIKHLEKLAPKDIPKGYINIFKKAEKIAQSNLKTSRKKLGL